MSHLPYSLHILVFPAGPPAPCLSSHFLTLHSTHSLSCSFYSFCPSYSFLSSIKDESTSTSLAQSTVKCTEEAIQTRNDSVYKGILVCLCVCMYVCNRAYECAGMLACVLIWRPRLMLGVFLKTFIPYFLRQRLSMNLNSQLGQGNWQ